MKSNLPLPKRLTETEENVIAWAFNLAKSIVAGDYHLPMPMNYAINHLQDAVHELARKRGITVEEGCTEEFLGYEQGYWDSVEKRLSAQGLRY